MAATRKKSRHWTRDETLHLISVWSEPQYQRQFEEMVHNHTVWEEIYRELLIRCPTINDFGDWVKVKERLDYLKRKYRDSLKNNRRTGSEPVKCPYFDELDAVLGCRPMNNPGELRMDNGGSSEDGASESCESGSTEPSLNTSRDNDAEGDAAKAPPPPAVEPMPQAQRRRKGRKTQIMEALEKGLERITQHDNTYDYEKERLEWEKEVERNRMELERKRLEFEMKRMETEDRRAKENRDLILQLFHSFRPLPPFSPYVVPHHFPYPSPHQGPSAENMDFSPMASTAPGPPAPSTGPRPHTP